MVFRKLQRYGLFNFEEMNRFELFTKEILADFAAKRNQPDFPSKLLNPTPANLRDYSLILLARKITKDDEKVLMDFYNPMGKYADLETAIKRFETAKLKPVQNFMLGLTKARDENIIKTVAVLIDFERRPYSLWKNEHQLDKATDQIAPDEPTENADILQTEQSQINDKEWEEGLSKTEKKRIEEKGPSRSIIGSEGKKNFFHQLKDNHLIQLTGLLTVTLILFTSIYVSQGDQCMCWVENQYIKVSCKEKNQSKIIALNKEKLYNLKKITRPDTLTIHDVNKVWYSKINNEVEFFTTSGMHPVHENRSLKIATKHIIEQYAGKNAMY